MRAFEKDLAHLRGLIESRDAEGLMEVFGRASQARRGLFPSAGALQGRAAEEKKNAGCVEKSNPSRLFQCVEKQQHP